MNKSLASLAFLLLAAQPRGARGGEPGRFSADGALAKTGLPTAADARVPSVGGVVEPSAAGREYGAARIRVKDPAINGVGFLAETESDLRSMTGFMNRDGRAHALCGLLGLGKALQYDMSRARWLPDASVGSCVPAALEIRDGTAEIDTYQVATAFSIVICGPAASAASGSDPAAGPNVDVSMEELLGKLGLVRLAEPNLRGVPFTARSWAGWQSTGLRQPTATAKAICEWMGLGNALEYGLKNAWSEDGLHIFEGTASAVPFFNEKVFSSLACRPAPSTAQPAAAIGAGSSVEEMLKATGATRISEPKLGGVPFVAKTLDEVHFGPNGMGYASKRSNELCIFLGYGRALHYEEALVSSPTPALLLSIDKAKLADRPVHSIFSALLCKPPRPRYGG